MIKVPIRNLGDPNILLPIASTTVLGAIKVGENLSIESDGTLNATDTIYTLPAATESTLGGVKPDGTTITVTQDGTISAEEYELPTASASVLGGVKVGENLSIDNSGVLSATDTTYEVATTSVSGLMSSSDKSKLDGIEVNANNYTLPEATTSTLGGIKVGSNLTIDNSGILSATDTTYEVVTTSSNGLMSSSDKSKLDGIEANANNYVLPTASTSTLGGVYVDNLLDDTSENPVQNKVIISNFYQKGDTYTKTEVNELIGQISTLNIEVVETLPTTGESATIYLVPKASSQTRNVYDEFVYVSNAWEKIGDTEIDLSNYLQLDGESSNTTVSFNQASSLANIISGETLSVICGKIAKSIVNLSALETAVGSINTLLGDTSLPTTADTVTGAIAEHETDITGLSSALDAKAPTNHASSSNTYGLSTSSVYGHTLVVNSLTEEAYADGKALSAYQGTVLKGITDQINTLLGDTSLPTTADTVTGAIDEHETDITGLSQDITTHSTNISNINTLLGNTTLPTTADTVTGAIAELKGLLTTLQTAVETIQLSIGKWLGSKSISSGASTFTVTNSSITANSIVDVYYAEDSVSTIVAANPSYTLSAGTLTITFETATTAATTIKNIKVVNPS